MHGSANECQENKCAKDLRQLAETAASELQDSITLTLDNIADSQLESDAFDIIFDRGCFHSICLFAAEEYVFHIKRIAKITGIVFIKTMSIHEERFVQYDKIGEKNLPMPYRFEKAELEKFFNRHFHSYNIEPSAFFFKYCESPWPSLVDNTAFEIMDAHTGKNQCNTSRYCIRVGFLGSVMITGSA